jgi:mannitol/fructose-specific phosphotransferase system IIA component (Ntr-type)
MVFADEFTDHFQYRNEMAPYGIDNLIAIPPFHTARPLKHKMASLQSAVVASKLRISLDLQEKCFQYPKHS